MFLLRAVLVLVATVVGASVLAYLFSRDRRYLGLAWRVTRWALIFVFILLALMFFERALAPVAGLV